MITKTITYKYRHCGGKKIVRNKSLAPITKDQVRAVFNVSLVSTHRRWLTGKKEALVVDSNVPPHEINRCLCNWRP